MKKVFAFLDDLYVLTTLPRARVARDVVAGAVEAGCGIASNHGKTRIPAGPMRQHHPGGRPRRGCVAR